MLLSGDCGTDVSWVYLESNVLYITGKGKMRDYEQGKAPWYRYSRSMKSFIIENGVTGIGANAFTDCVNLTEIVIPKSVTTIGRKAFAGCEGLQTIVFPNSVESIGEEAFSNCIYLKNVYVPLSVATIGEKAFDHGGEDICYVNYEGTEEQWNTMIGKTDVGGDHTQYSFEISMPR